MAKRILLMVFVFLFVSSGVHAMNLSVLDMERFIKTTKALAPHFDEFDDDDDYDDDYADGGEDLVIFNPEETKQLVMEAFSESSEMRNIVTDNGYSSVQTYAQEYAYIIRAYMASTGVGRFAELERSMASMSPEQRQAFENLPFYQALSETKKQLASIPEAHIQAITPYMDQLHELFGHDDDEDDFF
ncbi:hypothetical protein [Desulfonatronum thioautotrophicum]|uniref:hypothetical protein n=1 Tax=Desulfonatronum thioautotrophicum TaxID=617001 RepID=UPI0005EB70FB|nr:hypothetical protein [Desulfonatronum thioautotrophicum]